jgi:hypothetical protein
MDNGGIAPLFSVAVAHLTACYAITKWLGYTSYACNTTTELDTHQGIHIGVFPFFIVSITQACDNAQN